MAALIKIVLASIIILILLSFFYSESRKLKKINRFLIVILSVLLLLFVIFYEIAFDKQSEENRKLLDAFNQGKTIICKEYEVSQNKFNFIGGTRIFSTKDNIKELQGVILSIDECRLQ